MLQTLNRIQLMKALYISLDLKEEFYQFQTQKGCISYMLLVRLDEVTLYISVGLCLVNRKYSVITSSEGRVKHMTDSWPSTALHMKTGFPVATQNTSNGRRTIYKCGFIHAYTIGPWFSPQ